MYCQYICFGISQTNWADKSIFERTVSSQLANLQIIQADYGVILTYVSEERSKKLGKP